MNLTRSIVITAGALALTAATLTPAHAEGEFAVTANGVTNGGTLSALPPSSSVQMAVSNLPANVGLYAFHCLVPGPGASPVPTRCDAGTGALVYVMAAAESQTTTRPLVVNAEFVGKNPNPQAGDSGTTDVNCRVDTCAIYTLGAGRDSANRAYITFFPTQFASTAPRLKDSAVVTLDNRVVRPGRDRAIRYGQALPFSVTLASGITPSLSSKKCDVRNGEIRALTRNGSCAVQITSPGNEEYRAFRATVTFKILK
ncbi:MAG: hypothetical protein RL134_351 [Actinomycetota bacterium]|jgi:hypothetical protein